MNDSLLVYAYPTYSRKLHYNSKNYSIVLAPDEMLLFLKERHKVTVVNACPFPTSDPLMRSKIIMNAPETINPADYGYCWHMFRDPLQPEVAGLGLPSCIPPHKTINHRLALARHYKHIYLPILHKYNIGPAVFPFLTPTTIEWGPTAHSVAVSLCKKYIKAYDYNNNRGDYPEREKNKDIIVEYLDAEKDNQRSFFRVGYACGTVTEGWLYTGESIHVIQKTGTCPTKEPHNIPAQFHEPIRKALTEMGIDMAHLEGCYVNGQLKLFDINPYPTSYGASLTKISEEIADIISHHMVNNKPFREVTQ
jgi:hypothetical protein